MPLVSTLEIVHRAMKGRYAVATFNFGCLDMIRPIIEAAEAESAPVILQMAPGQIKVMGLKRASAAARTAAAEARVPVGIHLDHGDSFELAVLCVQAGFTSLMFGGSALPYNENVRASRRVVELAHAAGIAAEVEIGVVPNASDKPSADSIMASLTDPDQAKAFIGAVDGDLLAVAVGNVHGMTTPSAMVDLPRIAAIREKAGRPLVLHGGSGVPYNVVPEAIANGICKINVATALNSQFHAALRQHLLENPDQRSPLRFLPPAMAQVCEAAAERIRLFGSSGKAFA